MRGLLTIQTDNDFCVHYKGEWMYDSTVVIQIESMDDLKEVGLIDKHDGSGKSDGVREYIEDVIRNPHCGHDSTGGNRGILWVPNATKSPTLRDIINKHLPHIRLEGLDDIAALDTIIGDLVQERDDLQNRYWNLT